MSLILWSGGCDSTLLLFQFATQALAAGLPTPRAISISYDQIPAAVQHKKARSAILRELRRRGMRVEHTELELRRTGENQIDGSHGGLPQPVLWLGVAQAFLRPDEDLCLGYIRGDDIWHYRAELGQLFDATQRLLKKTGQLLLPLEWESKDDVLKALKDAQLDSFTWYCETVRGEAMVPCGWCPSCKAMAAGRYLAKRKWGYDKPPASRTDDEEKQPAPRRSRQAQRKKTVARGRRKGKAAEDATRKTARSRRLRKQPACAKSR